MSSKHDVIWLTDELGDEGLSWCEDSQNERDVKYLLATPAREAATELLMALEGILNECQLVYSTRIGRSPTAIALAAIAKATGKELAP